ncbi:hypothetical protein AAHC03_0352 [Spirometra sp. Aus1]
MGYERRISLTLLLLLGGAVEDTVGTLITLYMNIILAPSKCIQEALTFNYCSSIRQPLEYLLNFTLDFNAQIETTVTYVRIPGCTLQEADRASHLLDVLDEIIEHLDDSTAFSVILGPTLGGECQFVSDWIALGSFNEPSYKSLYQISYACRPQNQKSIFTDVVSSETEWPDRSNGFEVCALSMALKIQTLARGLWTLLRFSGWSQISILYEVGSKETSYVALGQNLAQLLSAAGGDGLTRLQVLHHCSLREGNNVSNTLVELADSLQGL